MRRVTPMIAVLIGAVLSGCAQDDGPDALPGGVTATSEAPPEAAPNAPALAEQIEQQVPARPTLRVEMDIKATSGGVQRASVRIEGVIRIAAGNRVDMDLDSTTTEDGVTETGRVIVLNRVVYVQQEGEEAAPGKPWLRMSRADLAALDDPAAAELKALLQQLLDQVEDDLRGASPTDSLVLMEKGKFTARPKRETIGGETMTRYQGRTDITALSTEERYAQLPELGVTQLPWTVWVDDDGLLRQFGLTLRLRTEKGTVRTVAKAAYSDWGQPVSITAPPSTQVATVADLGG